MIVLPIIIVIITIVIMLCIIYKLTITYDILVIVILYYNYLFINFVKSNNNKLLLYKFIVS